MQTTICKHQRTGCEEKIEGMLLERKDREEKDREFNQYLETCWEQQQRNNLHLSLSVIFIDMKLLSGKHILRTVDTQVTQTNDFLINV